MKTNDLRKTYLDFFKSKGHVVFPSDTLVPDDPTVLFTSAGMNQFKPYFLGEKKDVKRATSCQKCLRTGDIDEVGKTPCHHTFFEMLGNFSFGDYFKKEAIEFAWEFLTKKLNLKGENLWISVYREDDEAYKIWQDHIGILPQKIVKLGEKHNFWPANAPSLGPNGPCGPCSEIFVDQGENIGCRKSDCSPACDCRRFIEVWNLVFTQFNRVGENKLEPLPQKNIDTGMGLERMAAVLQGKKTNFQIDILGPIVHTAASELKLSGVDDAYLADDDKRSLLYAIVDHVRAATFAITDGVYPSNEERGYVVRKIIRKASYSAHILGKKEPFLYKLSDHVVEVMKDPYADLKDKRGTIAKVIQVEEEKFLSTLKDGESQISIIIDGLKKSNNDTIAAVDLFRLHDTFGFPLEICREIAKRENLKIDEQGFDGLFKQQQALSRKGSMFDADIFKQSKTLSETTQFIGYDYFESKVNILRIMGLDSPDDRGHLIAGTQGVVVMDKTPFYPEGGGQLTDKGIIKTNSGIFQVSEVFKVGEAILHKGTVSQGEIKKGEANACVDLARRNALMRAHTATHLLQAALRKVLGNHVMQQGSLVDEDRLRFDFTHFKGLTSDQLRQVEDLVNEFIIKANVVDKRFILYETAKAEGALAFFKDKYKDQVRVVTISDYSKELCGGTHIDNTAQISLFSIVSEASISSGVRRIEAVVGREAHKVMTNLKNSIGESAAILKCNPTELKCSLEKVLIETRGKDNQIDNLEKEIISLKVNDIYKQKKKINAVDFLAYSLDNKNYSVLLTLCDFLRKENQLFIFIASRFADKNIFVCAVSDDLVKKGILANKFVNQYKDDLLLKGGGKDNLVQGVILGKDDNLLKKVEDCFLIYSNTDEHR